MKRPSFQFYPGDWQRDAALRSCSIGARGLWIEMICIMHQADPYGYLVVNGKPIGQVVLARMVGGKPKEIQNFLEELSQSGVFQMDGEFIVSRRMVRDEIVRKSRADGGRLGGNPALKVNHEVACKVNHQPNLAPTPSSSSSSSSSSSPSKSTALTAKADARATRLPADWEIPHEWIAWAIEKKGWPYHKAAEVSLSFKDYWIARAGKDATKVDWFATWRNWCRNQRETQPQQFGKTSQGIALLEQMKG